MDLNLSGGWLLCVSLCTSSVRPLYRRERKKKRADYFESTPRIKRQRMSFVSLKLDYSKKFRSSSACLPRVLMFAIANPVFMFPYLAISPNVDFLTGMAY